MFRRIFAITTYHESGERASEAAEHWKRLGVCAIGWSEVNLCGCRNKEDIRKLLRKHGYNLSEADNVLYFVREISEGDLVLAYSRDNTIAYVGEVKGPCKLIRNNAVGDPDGRFGYAHQRKVEWWDEPHHFDRHDLPQHLATQFGKRGATVTEVNPGSKGSEGFINVVKVCANSGSKLPGINEDAIKAGLVKYLHHTLDTLETGITIKSAEVTIGREKRPRPDFIAEDKQGRTILIECKGTAGESAVEQIQAYRKEYGEGKDPRLLIVAFRINEACRLAAKKAGNVELIECDLNFRKAQ